MNKITRKEFRAVLFCVYIEQMVESLKQDGKFGTAGAYHYAAVSFLKFRKGEDISLNDITPALIKAYENHLKAKNKSMNTISCYMRSLRAVFNQAVKEKVFLPKRVNNKPFSGVFTGYAKTKKRAIGVEEIRKLEEVRGSYGELDEVQRLSPSITQSLYLFMFSFFTQGMTFVDMVNLKKMNIKENIICYKRKKTGQEIIVELADCMRKIIERYYGNNSDYIFPVLRKWERRGEFNELPRGKPRGIC